MKTTNFFTELHAILGGLPVEMSITPNGERLVLSFLPDKEKKGKLIPLNMEGTPEEFNEAFFQSIEDAVSTVQRTGLVTNKEEFEESATMPEKTPATKPAAKVVNQRKSRAGQSNDKKPVKSPVAQAVAKEKETPKKRGRKSNAERASAAEVAEPAKEEIVISPNQLSLLEEEAPAPPQHTDEDLAIFKDALDSKRVDVKDELAFLDRLIEKGSDKFSKEDLQQMKTDETAKLEGIDRHLERIEDKTFGVIDGILIPVEKLTLNPLLG